MRHQAWREGGGKERKTKAREAKGSETKSKTKETGERERERERAVAAFVERRSEGGTGSGMSRKETKSGGLCV